MVIAAPTVGRPIFRSSVRWNGAPRFGAASEPFLGGDAYVMRAERQTAVLAPWGRTDGNLVFLFALGHPGATEELVTGILDGEG